jgi:cation transport ATPase
MTALACWHCAGGNSREATVVAEAVGIEHFQANMRPEDKLAFVKRYNQSRQDAGVCFDMVVVTRPTLRATSMNLQACSGMHLSRCCNQAG